jgi:hypothetical protein
MEPGNTGDPLDDLASAGGGRSGAIAANLRLAGLDDKEVDLLLHPAIGLDSADLQAIIEPSADRVDAARELAAGGDDWLARYTDRTRSLAMISAPKLAKHSDVPEDLESVISWYDALKEPVHDWAANTCCVPDPSREATSVVVHPTLYCVAIDQSLEATQDRCKWSTIRTVERKTEFSIGLAGVGISQTTTTAIAKTFDVAPGSAVRVYAKATAVLTPTLLRTHGRTRKRAAFAIEDLRLSNPAAIGLELLPSLPAANTSRPLHPYLAQTFDDAMPSVWLDSTNRKKTFDVKVSFGSGVDDILGLSVELGTGWSAEHSVTQPPDQAFTWYCLEDLPGAILLPE